MTTNKFTVLGDSTLAQHASTNNYVVNQTITMNGAVIEDAIADAVTTKAPSQNAVFDALALKEDSLGFVPVNKAGDAMGGALAMGANKITGLGDPPLA